MKRLTGEEVAMSFGEDENSLAWWCERCSAVMEFERRNVPGYFMDCVSELKARGWRIERTQDGDWAHTCPKCRKGETARVMNTVIR